MNDQGWGRLLAVAGALATILGGGGYWAGGLSPQQRFDSCLTIVQTQAETLAYYQRAQRSQP